MKRHKRLGILIPSSNTIVESEAPDLVKDKTVTLHFSRFPVINISNAPDSLAQFELDSMVAAATLLADARVDLIAWVGTAASWLGFERDDAFCKAVETKTKVSATTAVLAINHRLKALAAKQIGLITPYNATLEKKIMKNYESIGIRTTAAERLDLATNTEMAAVTAEKISEMCRSVARSTPECIVIMCTNLRGASVSTNLSDELAIPVIDSVAATFQHALTQLDL
jgi:maleate isomerase